MTISRNICCGKWKLTTLYCVLSVFSRMSPRQEHFCHLDLQAAVPGQIPAAFAGKPVNLQHIWPEMVSV